ncbi:MAG TPA: ABC transporter ATP-binding protein, partial [Stellaceae bacterium]|nr:ABC transporter ATP-binding protein [Stellaceae bacterium]
MASHLVVLVAVLAAVACAIGSQYGIKNLVDALAAGGAAAARLWSAVALLLALVAGDNLLWRLGGWVAARAFVAVGGDLRIDLFDHLSGHGSRYFTNRFPGAVAGRVTTAANAAFSLENSLAWTTLPPAAAVVSSIAVLGLVNWRMMAVLAIVAVVIGVAIWRLAARSRYLHDRVAARAAVVTGDLTDVVSNMGLVRAFGAAGRERRRLSGKIEHEMSAQQESLRSLERLRLFHAVSVFVVSAGALVWSVLLWRAGEITTGDVVLTTTLGFTVLHASRDLAMA